MDSLALFSFYSTDEINKFVHHFTCVKRTHIKRLHIYISAAPKEPLYACHVQHENNPRRLELQLEPTTHEEFASANFTASS
jgi:hypothetical protein